MRCSCCSNSIDLETKRDKDTGMFENYWWCTNCTKKVMPQPEESAGGITLDQLSQAFDSMYHARSKVFDQIIEREEIDWDYTELDKEVDELLKHKLEVVRI